MKLLFSLITLLAIPMIITAQDGYIEDFQKKWQNAADYTIEVAELMPEEFYDFKPTEDQRTFKGQLLHMVQNMSWLSSSYLGGKKSDKNLKSTAYSKKEIMDILQEGFRLSGEAVAQLKQEQLDEIVEFFAGPMHKRQILTLMNDHLTHHRGQAIVYLRLKGVKPPRYRGW